MIWSLIRAVLILLNVPAFAMLCGNPAEPCFVDKGIWLHPSCVSLRVGYLDDWVYLQRFQDEFELEGVSQTQTYLKLSTYAGIATLNIANRLDLYGIAGSSRMQLDKEIFTKRAFSWALGTKFIIVKHHNFFLGGDIKYFETNQKPKYFVVEDLPYNITSNYRLNYQQMQASIGCCYRAWIFAPYINGTYILTRIDPKPQVVLVRLPDVNELADIESGSITCHKRWGMALGLTLLDSNKASLSFEWRTLNQNAVDINGEIRF